LRYFVPGTLETAIKQALVDVDESTAGHINPAGAGRAEAAYLVGPFWFRLSESLTVEIDTEAATCVVLENR
jgi:hypothetical protein